MPVHVPSITSYPQFSTVPGSLQSALAFAPPASMPPAAGQCCRPPAAPGAAVVGPACSKSCSTSVPSVWLAPPSMQVSEGPSITGAATPTFRSDWFTERTDVPCPQLHLAPQSAQDASQLQPHPSALHMDEHSMMQPLPTQPPASTAGPALPPPSAGPNSCASHASAEGVQGKLSSTEPASWPEQHLLISTAIICLLSVAGSGCLPGTFTSSCQGASVASVLIVHIAAYLQGPQLLEAHTLRRRPDLRPCHPCQAMRCHPELRHRLHFHLWVPHKALPSNVLAADRPLKVTSRPQHTVMVMRVIQDSIRYGGQYHMVCPGLGQVVDLTRCKILAGVEPSLPALLEGWVHEASDNMAMDVVLDSEESPEGVAGQPASQVQTPQTSERHVSLIWSVGRWALVSILSLYTFE